MSYDDQIIAFACNGKSFVIVILVFFVLFFLLLFFLQVDVFGRTAKSVPKIVPKCLILTFVSHNACGT